MKKSLDYWARLGFVFIVRALAASALLLVLFCSLLIYNFLRPPHKVASGTVLAHWHIQPQPVDLHTTDGVRLSAWYTPSRNGAVILVAHPFRDHRPEWVYEMLVRKGYGVLAWDARAHGTSGGDFSTIGSAELLDVKAALDYALSRPGVTHLGAWGGSMGGATVIRAAAQYPQIEAVFADSSFASLSDELDFLIPFPLISPLAKVLMRVETGVNVDDVDPTRDIAKISPRAVFIAQGTSDDVAPPDSAQRLFRAAGKPRFLWVETGIPHLGLYFNNPRRYQRRMLDFFDHWLLNK